MLTGATLAEAGVDAVACKPSEVDVRRTADLDVSTVTVDYEGREHLPAPSVLADLAAASDRTVRLTTPVRADGFDPLGDHSVAAEYPETVGRVLVAGHGAYLTDEEVRRAVAPRLRRAAAAADDPWIGTESVERVAMAVGGTQFELLSRTTARDVRSLRAAGFDGTVAVYAPTVLSTDGDAVLDAVGEYVSRRPAVARALPDGAATDADADGRAREVLARAAEEFALVGDVETVADRVADLRGAGVDRVVAYPARGLDPLLS